MLQCFFSSPTIIHSYPGIVGADLPGNANLPIGGLRNANQEIGVPRRTIQLMNRHPTVSAIVPARNEEATIAAAIESLASQPEITEIIVINDQSTDGTSGALKQLSARYARLRALETKELPGGWVGKNYAISL